MLRCVSAMLAITALLSFATSAHAQMEAEVPKSTWWSRFCRDYHRNVDWPEPFVMPDRIAVKAPFAIQIANGWRKQNLMSDYHFNEDKPQLNLAGESKLRYILTQMPPSRRTVFVQRGLTAEDTANRMAIVQRSSARILPPGYMADIAESDLPSDGWPADDIDAVARRFNSTRPDPRIKDSSGGGGGGGGYSASGSGGSGQ